MSDFRLSRRARADLAEIWRYTFSRWGRDQADEYVRAIHEVFARLMAKPSLGRPFPDAPKDVRGFRVGSHVVFFRKTRTHFYVVRILHQSVDYVRHLR
jgi:toxin ParE1/3/4